MTVAEQRAMALAKGQERRLAIAHLREQIRKQQITLEELMLDPPEVLSNYAMADVLRFPRVTSRYLTSPALTTLGKEAIRDGVNLMVAFGDASARTKGWVVENGYRWITRP